MMKKNYVITLALLASVSSVFAQAPPIKWQNASVIDTPKITYYPNGEIDQISQVSHELKKLIQLKDGNYIGLIGFTNVAKFNATGDTIFTKKLPSIPIIEGYSSAGNTYLQYLTFSCIDTTADGGFILSGTKTGSTWYSRDAHYLVLLKLDANGNKQWMEEYRTGWYTNINTGELTSHGVVLSDDGGYVFCATSSGLKGNDKSEDTKGETDYWIVKTDATGLVQWEKTIGGSGYDDAKGIIKTNDGGYIIAGSSASPISGDKSSNQKGGINPLDNYDFWVVKIDATGNIKWDKTIGTSDQEEYISFFKGTADGGFILGGKSKAGKEWDKTDTTFGANDMWVLKFDAGGNIQWQKALGGNEKGGDYHASACQQADGSFVIGATSSSPVSGNKTEAAVGGYWVDGYWIEDWDGPGLDLWIEGYFQPAPSDYWVVKLSTAGDIVWQTVLGGDQPEYIGDVLSIPDGGILVAGGSSSGISGKRTLANKGATSFSAGNDMWFVMLKGCPNYSNITDTFCQGSTYNFNGQQLTQPGIYNAVLTNVDGCDSTVTLDLAMYATEKPVIFRNNATLSVTGDYTTYQWLLDGLPLSGATDSTIVFTSSGVYTILATNANGCTAISAPFTEFADGSVAQEDAMVIPNPAKDWVSIRFRNIIPSFYISIVSMEGKKMGLYNFTNTSRPRMDVRKLPAGVYLLRLFGSDGAHASFKMIKGK